MTTGQLTQRLPGPRILVVDDEQAIRDLIARALAEAGYRADMAGDGAAGLALADAHDYGLVILDLVMPDMDGRAFLTRLRQVHPAAPVLVLSCVDDVATKVSCLELGAQDYLTKPFSLAEFLARVRVRLRDDARAPGARAHGADQPGADQPGASPPDARLPGASLHAAHSGAADSSGPHRSGGHAMGEVIRAGDLVLDVWRLKADIGHGPVALTKLEFLLLRELAEHFGQPLRKEELLASIWGLDFDPGSNVVDVCVRRLRSKLGFDLIKTVRGAGYQLAS